MLFGNDASFVADVIQKYLPLKRKRSPTGFVNINCPMCHLNGHRPDRKMRCGIMFQTTSVGVTCFNCGHKSGYSVGNTLSRNFRDFLASLGVSDLEIKRLNHTAFTVKSMLDRAGIEVTPKAAFAPKFDPCRLPAGARSFERLAVDGCDDPDFLDVVEYTFGRGEDVASATSYYWTPRTEDGMNRRVIIPFYFRDQIVGWTARAIDKTVEPKYHNNNPANYLFNNHVMTHRDRAFVIVVEGIFDALAIDGVATGGARLNDQQIQWLKSCGKQIIVLPDRDTAGQRLIDHAISNDWHVAFPGKWWDGDVKDAADAVQRYGRLYTLTTILKSSTASKIEINVKRKLL